MKLLIVTLFVILPIVFSAPAEEKPRSLPLSGVAATGSLGANCNQQNAASETHDKKNFGLNYSSDRGNSNQYSTTGLQAAAAGGVTQGYPQFQYPLYQQYPYYPTIYPYSQYPYQVYPNYYVGVPNAGVPVGGLSNVGIPVGGLPNGIVQHNVGVGSNVQLPNVSASSGTVPTGLRY